MREVNMAAYYIAKFALISNSECMWLHNVLSFLSQCIEHDSHVENGSNIKFGLV
jgi:hypothetical protein